MATAKLFLDTRYSGGDDTKEVSLKIAINHRHSSSNIVLNVRLRPDQWNAKTNKVQNHPQKSQLNAIILQKLTEANTALHAVSIDNDISMMKAGELCKLVKARLDGDSQSKVAAQEEKSQAISKETVETVGNYFERYIEFKGLRKRTQAMYGVTWRKIEAWLGKERAAYLEFSEITYQWIEEFDSYLAEKSTNLNGRRIHHANLKAVINYAIDNELTDRNPYRRFKIRTQATKKKNMGVEALRMIIFASNLEPWMEKYRDFFVLSFMLRGLNTVDLCHLPKAVKGRVDWVRTKTGQPLSLKIEPEMQQLIDRYSGKERMLEFAESRHYRNFNDKLTKALHKIVAHINATRRGGVEVPDVTMYWARHTWASIAHKLDIAMDVIGTGLAHSQKSVTDIYIDRDPEKIDTANRRVLDYVLYGKDYRDVKAKAETEREFRQKRPRLKRAAEQVRLASPASL